MVCWDRTERWRAAEPLEELPALHLEGRITVQSIAVKSDTIQGDVKDIAKASVLSFIHLLPELL